MPSSAVGRASTAPSKGTSEGDDSAEERKHNPNPNPRTTPAGFDPEALERGARALREINKSPSAKQVRRGGFSRRLGSRGGGVTYRRLRSLWEEMEKLCRCDVCHSLGGWGERGGMECNYSPPLPVPSMPFPRVPSHACQIHAICSRYHAFCAAYRRPSCHSSGCLSNPVVQSACSLLPVAADPRSSCHVAWVPVALSEQARRYLNSARPLRALLSLSLRLFPPSLPPYHPVHCRCLS